MSCGDCNWSTQGSYVISGLDQYMYTKGELNCCNCLLSKVCEIIPNSFQTFTDAL